MNTVCDPPKDWYWDVMLSYVGFLLGMGAGFALLVLWPWAAAAVFLSSLYLANRARRIYNKVVWCM